MSVIASMRTLPFRKELWPHFCKSLRIPSKRYCKMSKFFERYGPTALFRALIEHGLFSAERRGGKSRSERLVAFDYPLRNFMTDWITPTRDTASRFISRRMIFDTRKEDRSYLSSEESRVQLFLVASDAIQSFYRVEPDVCRVESMFSVFKPEGVYLPSRDFFWKSPRSRKL